jgi:hypothetical protein
MAFFSAQDRQKAIGGCTATLNLYGLGAFQDPSTPHKTWMEICQNPKVVEILNTALSQTTQPMQLQQTLSNIWEIRRILMEPDKPIEAFQFRKLLG